MTEWAHCQRQVAFFTVVPRLSNVQMEPDTPIFPQINIIYLLSEKKHLFENYLQQNIVTSCISGRGNRIGQVCVCPSQGCPQDFVRPYAKYTFGPPMGRNVAHAHSQNHKMWTLRPRDCT